jgi:glucose/arabinose dehydrogenase
VDFNGSASVGNPFTEEGFESYFAYGIRNSLGLAFDPITLHLWDTEQGPGSKDEINLVRPGFNSGWKTIQGFSNTTCCSDNIQTLQNIYKLYKIKGSYYDEPKAVFENSSNLTAITFQGTDLLGSKYNNTMFVGDMLGKIYNFDLSKNRGSLIDKNNSSEYNFAEGFGPISDMKVGPDGKLYVLVYSNGFKYPYDKNTGTLYRISTLDSPIQLSERNIISIEQIALIATFLIILSILVTLRFKYTLRKLIN